MQEGARFGDRAASKEWVDPELGLTARGLAETLRWARSRANELLEDLDDDELCALLGRVVEQAEPFVAHEPVRAVETAHERREEVRFSLVEPAVVEVESWSELVALYTRDISCGGMFVQTASPPPIDARVAVRLVLPDGAGTLRFEGVVVHVVPTGRRRAPGFGLHFVGLTADARRKLQRIIERAEQAAEAPVEDGPTLQELGFTCAPSRRATLRMTLSEAELEQLRDLRWELAALESRGDLEVLGLGSSADLEQVQRAFERLAARWHPGMAHRGAPAEIRALVTEIFLRIERAYKAASERLRERRPSMMASHANRPRRVRAPLPQVDETPEPTVIEARTGEAAETEPTVAEPTVAEPTTAEAGEPTVAQAAEPTTAEVKRRQRATQRLDRIIERGERLAARLQQPAPTTEPTPAEAPTATPAPRSRQLRPVDRALELVAARRWGEAVEPLEQALLERPSTKLEVLLRIVQARHAAVEGDLGQARRRYEQVLELEPAHAVAQRELLMVAAMDG